VPDYPQSVPPDAAPLAFINLSFIRFDCETSHNPVSFSAWVNSGPLHKEKLMSHDACSHAPVVTPWETESLGSLLDALTRALRDQHYAASTIRTHLREARAFGAWLTARPYQLRDCNELLLARYFHSCTPSVPLHKRRRQRITAAIHRLLEHLRTAGVVALPSVERLPETEVQQWLSQYGAYLDHVLGLAPTTRQKYLFFATRLLQTLSHQGDMTWSALPRTQSPPSCRLTQHHAKASGLTEPQRPSGRSCAFSSYRTNSLQVWTWRFRRCVGGRTRRCPNT
jgi:hypothetical protein